MSRSSIRPDEITEHVMEWPKDRYIVRHVNGDNEQHFAVCDATTWGIVTLSYTEHEAEIICQRFNNEVQRQRLARETRRVKRKKGTRS